VSSEAAAAEIVKTIEAAYGVKAFALRGDMGLEADCVRLVEESIEKLGGLDIIVSNAVSPPHLPQVNVF
jgi:NAD(P)-dependent dehydrogenase (short-subunit alcohol dehydrogenase family)